MSSIWGRDRQRLVQSLPWPIGGKANPYPTGAGPLVGRFQILGALPTVSKPLAWAVGLGVVPAAILPLDLTLARGILVGAVPGAVRGGLDSPAGHQALLGLAGLAALSLLARVIGPVRTALVTGLAERLQLHLEERVMRAVARPAGIAHLEDPAVLDRIALAQEVGTGGYRPSGALIALNNLAPLWLQSIIYALVLARFRWWLALAVFAAWYYASYVKHRETYRTGTAAANQTHLLRRANYLRDLGMTPEPAKEVRVFGLASWLVQRFEAEWFRSMVVVWRERQKGTRPMVIAMLLLTVVLIAALVQLGLAALHGEIGLGALTVFTGAAFGIGSFMGIGADDSQLEFGTVAVPAIAELEALTADGRETGSVNDATGTTATTPARAAVRVHGERGPTDPNVEGLPRERICFEDVTFHYPGSAAATLSHLDLTIPVGRSLAIVGVNGAGKTTLIKLLCRLYEPTAHPSDGRPGRITVDGIDLRRFDAGTWQRQIAAIFQDFARFHLPLRDNVGFGAVDALVRPDAHVRLMQAAERAGVLDLVQTLPKGWETVLSREYAGGTELSGGQWQRVALARALFAAGAGARLLVLDEPTANLDVRAEADLYDRFLEITAGLTTILISHRFSTVRRADLICVLADGKIVERGTHEELVATGGRYAAMFALQASRFTEEPEAQSISTKTQEQGPRAGSGDSSRG